MNNIHPTAIIESKNISDNVSVGPWTYIRQDVQIGEGTQIGSHCVLEGNTEIGKNCSIFKGSVVGSIPQSLKFHNQKTYLKIADRVVIREFVTINPGCLTDLTSIGNNVLIMAYCHIAHDCKIGDDVIMANNAGLAGHIEIHNNAVLGGFAAIHQFVRIGEYSMVGGMSKIVQDVPPFSLVDGRPGKVCGLNVIGLRRANFSPQTRATLYKAFKILFFSGLSTTHALVEVERRIVDINEVKKLVEFVKTSKRGIAR
ncbi:acyl-[acyl-carrier-protein]--UDP-N-acetylglucosamine O-acyltransferase [bacterium Unc6]|nr:acyl-[acyl-carrier-protein]--UDP-N-acetylglucosamine O-acyltransferase [bacterium Unc6]